MKCINCKHYIEQDTDDYMASVDCEHQEECMSGMGNERLKWELKATTEFPKCDE
jgi:hypothetical protein